MVEVVRRGEAAKESPFALFVGRVSDLDDGVTPARQHLQGQDFCGAGVATKDAISPSDATNSQLDEKSSALAYLRTESIGCASPAGPVRLIPPDARCSDSEVSQAVDASPFACGLFSDGRLVLEVGADVLTLSQDQAYQLISYLDRFAGPVHRGPDLAAATPAAT